MKLPEPERLKQLNRFDNHIQLWFVPLSVHPLVGPELKAYLVPSPLPHEYHREIAYLGKGKGYAWYAYMSIPKRIRLQQEFELKDGNDPVEAAIRGLGLKDNHSWTSNSSAGLLENMGVKALLYLEKAVESPDYRRVIRVLGRMKGPQAAALLVKLASSAENERATLARKTLIFHPRLEAESLYVLWLLEDAGKRKGSLRPANEAGVIILKSLPDGRGLEVAKLFYDESTNSWKDELLEIHERLGLSLFEKQ